MYFRYFSPKTIIIFVKWISNRKKCFCVFQQTRHVTAGWDRRSFVSQKGVIKISLSANESRGVADAVGWGVAAPYTRTVPAKPIKQSRRSAELMIQNLISFRGNRRPRGRLDARIREKLLEPWRKNELIRQQFCTIHTNEIKQNI